MSGGLTPIKRRVNEYGEHLWVMNQKRQGEEGHWEALNLGGFWGALALVRMLVNAALAIGVDKIIPDPRGFPR